MAQSWQAGDGLPHWTPLILSGMPLAANQLAMLSYPPAWLFLIFPIEPTLNLLFVFHLLLGAFGVYLLLTTGHKLSAAAAVLGALTYVLNGKWLAHIAGGHVSMVGAVAWMPWVIFGLLMLLQRKQTTPTNKTSPAASFRHPLIRDLGWAILVAVALAMQIVTHTLLFIYNVYLILAMVAWYFIGVWRSKTPSGLADTAQTKTAFPALPQPRSQTGVWEQVRRLFWPLLSIPLLAGLLGATQLLPLLELVEHSNRSLNLTQATEYSVTPIQLIIGLLLPSAQGGHEFVIYLGLVPLLLIPLGLTRRNSWTWFYALLFIFTILFALGSSTPIHSLFYYGVPGFRWVRTPARMFFVTALATSVLVAFAVEQLTTSAWSDKMGHWLTRLAVGIGALALLFALGLIIGFGLTGRAAWALALLVPLTLGLLTLYVWHIIPRRLTLILLGLLVLIDLASFDISMMKFIPLTEALAPGRPVAEYLTHQVGHFRSYSPSYTLPIQTAAAYNLHLADGVEPVHLAIYDDYMARAGGYDDAAFSVTIPNFGGGSPQTALKNSEPNLKLLGLLNVRYLISAFPMPWPGLTLAQKIDNTYIYTNAHTLPRAWVVHQTQATQADWLTQLETLPDLSQIALIETGPLLPASTSSSTPVTITHTAPDLIKLETNLAQPGWLILSEIWYPGWQATVNSASQPVQRVNGLLRGIYLAQPGPAQITVTYRPRSIIWGNWISGLTIVFMIIFSVVFWRLRVRL